MKHMMRRATQLIAISLMLPLWPVGDADAVFESALRGEYDASLTRSCSTVGSTTASPQPSLLPPIALVGRLNFNGAGTVSFSGQALVPGLIPVSAGVAPGISIGPTLTVHAVQADFTSCTGTYTVDTDGTFFTPTFDCNITFTTSTNAGDNATLNGIKIRGRLASDGTVLVFGATSASASELETLNCPTCDGTSGGSPNNGFIQARLCSTTGVATARR